MSARPAFLTELKRRNVPRAVVLYAGAVWALAQGIAQLSPFFGAPGWIVRWFVIACAIGFPFWVAFAWYYQITLHGIRREPEVATDASGVRATARKLDYWIIGILAIAVVLLVTNTFVLHRDVTGRAEAASAKAIAAALARVPARSIAVLPFENLSADKKNAYFVAGMQDLILTKLADIGSLKVIARTSTERYPSRPDNLKQIAAQLGVATLLEGSVQKAGNQVLINVQLIDAKTDAHIWAKAYTRNLDNIFGVEGEVAGKIATALKARLTAGDSAQLAAVPTTNPQAYDLFLRAEYQARRADITFDPAQFKRAIALYRDAVAKDPQFALAYARLSHAEGSLAGLGGGGKNARELRKQARIDGERAVQLAPNLPTSQLLLASDAYRKRDFAGAMQHVDKALAARPNDADAFILRGMMQDGQDHFDAAIASYQQALAVDPRNATAANQLGAEYVFAGDDRKAGKWFRRAIALDPDSLGAKYNLAKVIAFRTGDITRALGAVRGDAPLLKVQRAQLLTLQRNFHAAIATLKSIPYTFHGESFAAFPKRLRLARLYRLAGATAQARALIEQASPADRAQLNQVPSIHRPILLYYIAEADLDLGHPATALKAVDKAQGILGKGDTRYPELMVRNAGVYAAAKRPDLAVPLLEKAFVAPRIGWHYSPILLWIDPTWDPIRHDPRFQALLKKYAKFKPAVLYAAPASASSGAGHG